jgi:hypothetical protein
MIACPGVRLSLNRSSSSVKSCLFSMPPWPGAAPIVDRMVSCENRIGSLLFRFTPRTSVALIKDANESNEVYLGAQVGNDRGGSPRVLHPHGLFDLTSDTRVSALIPPGVKLSLRNGRLLLTSLLWISPGPAGDVGAAEFQPCPFVAKSMASKGLRLLFGEGREADLSATLRQKKMPNLCHAVLSGINITGAVLSNLNMALADLRAANTAYSDMRGAN